MHALRQWHAHPASASPAAAGRPPLAPAATAAYRLRLAPCCELTPTSAVLRLQGHTSGVRAAMFTQHRPNVIVSGAADKTLR